jgi:hypothetical protein
MRVGRPPLGPEHVEKLEGSQVEKERLRVMLESLSGSLRVQDACRELGLGRSRFHELRTKALQGALDGLAPGVPGRPRKQRDVRTPRELELEREVGALRDQLVAERARSELALVMSHVVHEPTRPAEKGAERLTRNRARKRARAARRATRRASRR